MIHFNRKTCYLILCCIIVITAFFQICNSALFANNDVESEVSTAYLGDKPDVTSNIDLIKKYKTSESEAIVFNSLSLLSELNHCGIDGSTDNCSFQIPKNLENNSIEYQLESESNETFGDLSIIEDEHIFSDGDIDAIKLDTLRDQTEYEFTANIDTINNASGVIEQDITNTFANQFYENELILKGYLNSIGCSQSLCLAKVELKDGATVNEFIKNLTKLQSFSSRSIIVNRFTSKDLTYGVYGLTFGISETVSGIQYDKDGV